MMTILESEMNFGPFEEDSLFQIEDSEIYKELGDGIRTVEFILRYTKDSIIFLEAKKSCPNSSNRYESEEKREKFEEYFSSITKKFIDSLQIYLTVILNKYENMSEVGRNLQNVHSIKDVQLKFVLVVKTADITWLAGPLEELKARLLPIRKIWGIDVAVLNEELAKQYKIVKE